MWQNQSVGCVLYHDVWWPGTDHPPRHNNSSCTNTGCGSLTHNRVLHQKLVRFLRECKNHFATETHGLSTYSYYSREIGGLSPLGMDVVTGRESTLRQQARTRGQDAAARHHRHRDNPCVNSNLDNIARDTLRRRSRAKEQHASGLAPRS